MFYFEFIQEMVNLGACYLSFRNLFNEIPKRLNSPSILQIFQLNDGRCTSLNPHLTTEVGFYHQRIQCLGFQKQQNVQGGYLSYGHDRSNLVVNVPV